jgi:hypothetical protein
VEILGDWDGFYSYESSRMGVDVPFRLSVVEESELGFAGSIQDDANSGGHPMAGKITGHKLPGQRIKFVKEMPVGFFRTAGRSVIGGSCYRIHYQGNVGPDGRVQGEWNTRAGIIWYRWMPILHVPGRGKWEMWRPRA